MNYNRKVGTGARIPRNMTKLTDRIRTTEILRSHSQGENGREELPVFQRELLPTFYSASQRRVHLERSQSTAEGEECSCRRPGVQKRRLAVLILSVTTAVPPAARPSITLGRIVDLECARAARALWKATNERVLEKGIQNGRLVLSTTMRAEREGEEETSPLPRALPDFLPA